MEGDSHLFSALAGAEHSVARLDERVRGSPLAPGWVERMTFQEAVAWQYNRGELVSLEDLVLHDAGLDQRMPDQLVLAAHGAIRRRRRAALLHGDDLRQWPVMNSLLGRRRTTVAEAAAVRAVGLAAAALQPGLSTASGSLASPPSSAPPPFAFAILPSDLAIDTDEAAFEYWAAPRSELAAWTPLIVAAVVLDLWEQLEPLPRSSDVGPLVVEADLRALKHLQSSLLLVETGRRVMQRKGRRWRLSDSPAVRLSYWLDAIRLGADWGLEEMNRLSIARQRFDRLLGGRRRSSRLGDLADLFLRSPTVTATQGAAALGVSQQAVRGMIGELGGVLHEVTGRRSFRAWRV